MRSLLIGIVSLALILTLSACKDSDALTRTSESTTVSTQQTETATQQTATEPSTTVETTTEASTTEESSTEASTTEATTSEETTEATTTEPRETILPADFVRQLVIRTSELPIGTAGSSLQTAKLSADWVSQISISGFTEQNMLNTVRMAYDELDADAKLQFAENFQHDVAYISIDLLNGNEGTLGALANSGGELHPEHMSAERWQGYLDLVMTELLDLD